MAVRILLDRPHAHFTNLDFITGKVQLQLYTNETISNIVVKLEGESKTRLAVPEMYSYDRRDAGRAELEVHKVSRSSKKRSLSRVIYDYRIFLCYFPPNFRGILSQKCKSLDTIASEFDCVSMGIPWGARPRFNPLQLIISMTD